MAGFGTLSPGELAEEPTNILDQITAGMINAAVTLPKKAILAAATPPGLRREDFTDIPANTAVDPASPLGGVGAQFGRVGWQPGDELIGHALDTTVNVMGGTSLSAPVKAGEAALGAGPMRMIENADLLKELANQNRAKGYATGKSAAGWEFKRPDSAVGSTDRAIQEAKVRWGAMRDAAISPEAKLPQSPLMSEDDWVSFGAGAGDKRAAAATAAMDTAGMLKGRDPALWHGISKIKLPKPISEMSAVHVPTQPLNERIVPPSMFQGGNILPLLGDRTIAGTDLAQVNGFKFADPVPMQGGHGFMAANADQDAAWASALVPARRVANVVKAQPEGIPTYGAYTAMGERSGDFSHHVSDTLAEMFKHTPVANAPAKAFDAEMSSIAPGWPGIQSPRLKEYMGGANGAVRSYFTKLMDTAPYQRAGFPSVAEARFATTDPRLLNEPTGAAGLSISRLDGTTTQVPGQHRTYDTNVGGKYVGGLPTSIPKEIMFPDIVKPLEGYRDALPGFKPTIDYLMARTPKGLPLVQKADQQWVDGVSKHLEDRGFTLGAGATDRKAAAATAALDLSHAPAPPQMAIEAGQGARDAYAALHGPETTPATATATPAATGGLDVSGGARGGAAGVPEAQAAAARWAGARKPLEGLPTKAMKIGDEHFVPGPIGKIHDVAEDYMRTHHRDRQYEPPTKYHPLDAEHHTAIAKAFEEMPHAPNDPAVKASYDALIKETHDQFKAIKKTGLKIEPITPDMPDPYAANPRLAAKDVAENNHLYYFPTDQGFGAGAAREAHPMMAETGEKIGDKPLVANDMFRIVHDYFGHLKEGHGFRAAGEDNAYRTHSSMYSDLARPAMTTETRGQNSWLNYGPHGEFNRTAKAADTIYADQKVGLMPEWTMRDRGSPEPIIAYHGTPHSFDKFDPKHIGGGEGNQAYGQGLYFAEHEPVSEWYRHQLAVRRDPLLKKYGLDSEDGASVGMQIAAHGGDADAFRGKLQEHLDILQKSRDTSKAHRNEIERTENKIKFLSDPERSKGHLYQVAIDHPPEKMLDWDAPLSEQSAPVLEALRALKPEIPLTSRRPAGEIFNTEQLKKAGIPGIKYLDQGSRLTNGKKTRNYVTFDAPRILRKYAVPGAIGAGGFGALGRPRDNQ